MISFRQVLKAICFWMRRHNIFSTSMAHGKSQKFFTATLYEEARALWTELIKQYH